MPIHKLNSKPIIYKLGEQSPDILSDSQFRKLRDFACLALNSMTVPETIILQLWAARHTKTENPDWIYNADCSDIQQFAITEIRKFNRGNIIEKVYEDPQLSHLIRIFNDTFTAVLNPPLIKLHHDSTVPWKPYSLQYMQYAFTMLALRNIRFHDTPMLHEWMRIEGVKTIGDVSIFNLSYKNLTEHITSQINAHNGDISYLYEYVLGHSVLIPFFRRFLKNNSPSIKNILINVR